MRHVIGLVGVHLGGSGLHHTGAGIRPFTTRSIGQVGLQASIEGLITDAALGLTSFFFTTAIVTADRFSRNFEKSRHPDEGYKDDSELARMEENARKTGYEKFMDWGKENRYPIVGVSWVLSMGLALGIVGRSPYLSTQQKLVQARVYAQTLTIAVLIATAAFEVGDRGKGEGRWETIKVLDPNDPDHKHLIEKKIHHERYAGEDQWRGMDTQSLVRP